LITQQIFQKILDQCSVRTVEVKHNVTLQGKTLVHQIDVFWEFELGGIRYITVVQAKNWGTTVDQGKLLLFRAVLDDLPGQPRGIVVTRTGYQRGATEFARANGILVYKLTAMPDPPAPPPIVVTDVAPFAKVRIVGVAEQYRIVTEVETFIPNFTNTLLHIDTNWMEEVEAHFGHEVAQAVLTTSVHASPRDIPLYDAEGDQTGTLRDIYAHLVKEMMEQGLFQRDATTTFQQPTFMRISSLQVPFMKVTGISTTIDIRRTVSRRVGLPSFVDFILKNLSDGSVRRFQRQRSGLLKRPNS